MSARPFWAALVATCNRPQLLATRALPSVAAQRRRPDLLIVADDSQHRFCARNQNTLAEFAARHRMRALYVRNHRARGAAGCWNSGALAALRESPGLQNAYLAILDDDDEWLPAHLENAAAETSGSAPADVLIASHLRRESKRQRIMRAPAQLTAGDFFRGNPGVGGSTFIVRMQTFLRAGMFDESLPACTDRDLCIRLSMLPNVRYRPLPEVSAVHHAGNSRARISNPGGAKKTAGLSRFADKYRGCMSDAEWHAACARAKRLFGWNGAHAMQRVSPSPARENIRGKVGGVTGGDLENTVALIIGVILDPRGRHDALLGDIVQLAKDKRFSSLEVVMIASTPAHARLFQNTAAKWRGAGLRVYCMRNVVVHALARALGIKLAPRKTRAIAVNRMLLQYAAAGAGESHRAPVYWMLDGDMRLHGLRMRNGKPRAFTPDYAGEMLRLRARGCDVALGVTHGAAPLPRAMSVRAQLLDLLHFCARLNKPRGKRHFPARNLAHAARPETAPDYYHDCGAHPHLEQPLGLPPLPENCSRRRFLRELPKLLARMLAGDAVTRPLLDDAVAPHAQLHRGGNTLIFSTAALRQCPNGLLHAALAGMRRQDEIWRILGGALFGWKVASGEFAVTQVRAGDRPQAPDIARLQNDIAGHAVSRALQQVIGARRFDNARALATFLRRDSNWIAHAREFARRRIAMLHASFLRIEGIAGAMQNMIAGGGAESKHARAALQSLAKKFAHAVPKVTPHRCALQNRAQLGAAVATLPAFCKRLQALPSEHAPLKKWIRDERRQNAFCLLQKLAGANTRFRFLGSGEEGAVFTDGSHIYKVLHNWRSRAHAPHAEFFRGALRGTTPAWNANSDAPYPLLDSTHGGDLLLRMPYEKTARYTGGCGAGVTAMLSALRRRGLVARNIAPKNLRRKNCRVRLVDYGAQLQPFTERDFELAVRKAWLCCFWSFRGDLPALLSASRKRADLPELDGYARMKTAAEHFATYAAHCDDALEWALRESPARVLDYGCGKGKHALQLRARGIDTAAYDTAYEKKIRMRLRAAGVTVFDNERALLAADAYDAVLCRKVLCEIRGRAQLQNMLRNLRSVVTQRGCVILSYCDPNGIARETAHAQNFLPRNAGFAKSFAYQKRIRRSGRMRKHYYRPEHVVRREIARAGFRIVRRASCAGIDLQRFETCAGSVTYKLSPLPAAEEVTLVIRACAMEAETLEAQVHHLVRQLSFPRGFAEIVLALDSRAQNFLRPHCSGSMARLRDAAAKLLREEWVDRIVEAPLAAHALKNLNRKWMGIESGETHAAKGAPLAVVFAAFESCASPYALHVDADMLVGRKDCAHDYLHAMLTAMQKRHAVSMALNIAGGGRAVCERRGDPYRLEVRAGLTDLRRLKSLLPLPCVDGGALRAWHRAADAAIRRGGEVSLRGGDQRLFVMHPPNAHKQNREAWFNVLDAVEQRGVYPRRQVGNNEWDGGDSEWVGARRDEKFVFVICGRNVTRGRIDRCLDSLFAQDRRDWGAVVIDDASDAHISGYLRGKCMQSPRRGQISFIARRFRHGSLANLIFAVRRVCANPESVIITLDLDDKLIGAKVLRELARQYANGADLTVGGMLRTDKHAHYPVNFCSPRSNRGGNVWQHLRSFKKRLFDAIPGDELHPRALDSAQAELIGDWVYMPPMVEMAKHPAWVRTPLYLHEPGEKRNAARKRMRERAIALLLKNKTA